MEGLTEGRIVHYVSTEDECPGVRHHLAAIVVRVFGTDTDMANLTVFGDWSNDGLNPPGIFWATSRHYSETHEPMTWHWPKDDAGN